MVKLYLISLAVGILVGLIYGVLSVKSPAPPLVALVGLLGILIGEQAVPLVKKSFASPAAAATSPAAGPAAPAPTKQG